MIDDFANHVGRLNEDAHRFGCMKKKLDTAFWEFWKLILSDSHGVDQKAYEKLYEVAQTIDKAKTDELCLSVEATDGRFYLKG